MTNDCLELILDEVVKAEYIPASTCTLPLPYNVPDIASITGCTFGTPILTLAMDGSGDGDMDAAPTLQTKESDDMAGRTRQHTLTCTVNTGIDEVRHKSMSLDNIDIVVLLTYRDGGQKMIMPLPNTCNFTAQDNYGDLSHTMTVTTVVQSLSQLIDVD